MLLYIFCNLKCHYYYFYVKIHKILGIFLVKLLKNLKEVNIFIYNFADCNKYTTSRYKLIFIIKKRWYFRYKCK